jgi:hypothetical protein
LSIEKLAGAEKNKMGSTFKNENKNRDERATGEALSQQS